MEMLQLLAPLEAGIVDNNGFTALMWAARTNRAQSVHFLADFEADVRNDGRKASDYARDAGYLELAEFLHGKEHQ